MTLLLMDAYLEKTALAILVIFLAVYVANWLCEYKPSEDFEPQCV